MSLQRPRDGKTDDPLFSSYEHQQQQQQQFLETEATSSSWNRSGNNNNNTTPISHKNSKIEESDEDLFTVPDVEAGPPTDSTFINNTATANNYNNLEVQPGKRRRGRNPIDKEYRRLKRLLRNRVSAQQARERKKVYVNDLESRAKELQDKNSKLEEKISILMNENTMLRKHVLMNTRPKVDETIEPKQDQFAKS